MHRLPIAFALLLLSASSGLAQKEFGFDNRKGSGQPYWKAEETVAKFKVAPEFEVKLFAGEPQIVNSRVHQNVLIVDRLFGTAELRLGSGNRQQTVRIVRTNPTQAAAQPASATTGGSSS